MQEIINAGGDRKIVFPILRWESAPLFLLASCLVVAIVPVLLVATLYLVQATLAGTLTGSDPFLFLIGLALGGYLATASLQMLGHLLGPDARTMSVSPQGVLLPKIGDWDSTNQQMRTVDWDRIERIVLCESIDELWEVSPSIGGMIPLDGSPMSILDRRRRMQARDLPVIVVALNDGRKLAVTRVHWVGA